MITLDGRPGPAPDPMPRPQPSPQPTPKTATAVGTLTSTAVNGAPRSLIIGAPASAAHQGSPGTLQRRGADVAHLVPVEAEPVSGDNPSPTPG